MMLLLKSTIKTPYNIMILPIVTYPDKRLKEKSLPVKSFDDTLHTLLDDMNETMLSQNGIGLAAIQIAQAVDVLIINIPNEEGEQCAENLLEIINPKVLEAEGETTYQEGCLSVPGFYEDIQRFDTISIEYQDRHGETHTLHASELLSVALQHEMDHLEGKLFIEKLSYAKRKKFEKELKKKQREEKRKVS